MFVEPITKPSDDWHLVEYDWFFILFASKDYMYAEKDQEMTLQCPFAAATAYHCRTYYTNQSD